MSAAPGAMTRGDREDLSKLIKHRERVQVAAARQRSAELLADVEQQMAAEFAFDDDETWHRAVEEAEREVSKAQGRIAERCAALGIPTRFAPGLSLSWHRRGENAAKHRREELRRVAQTRVEALEREAIVRIQTGTVEALTQVTLAGLTSEAAHAFLAKLPTIESLMPSLSYRELAGDADPPVVEQLLSPGALRQRRYRERKALRGDVTSARSDANGDAPPGPRA